MIFQSLKIWLQCRANGTNWSPGWKYRTLLFVQKAKVIRSTGSWYRLRTEAGEEISCRLAGQFRAKGIQNTNPVAVGDQVAFSTDGKGTAVIRVIDARKNYLIRKSVNLAKRAHIIAANLDQSFLIVSLVPPRTNYGFIDRFLVTCEAYGISTHLVVNKSDLHGPEAEQELVYLEKAYRSAGYQVWTVSAHTGKGVEELRAQMKGQVNLLSGNSGVGKSSLINRLDPSLELRTQEISAAHQLGQHTTTFAEMFPLASGGDVIDTPGIKSFGLLDMEKQEIGHYFPELFALSASCRFSNCMHMEEPGCAVREAYEHQQLAPTRYENYVKILSGEDEESVYR